MSFRDCLNDAHAQGLLTDEDLKKAQKHFDDIAAAFARDFGPAGSAAEAARRTLDAIKCANNLKRSRLLLQRSASEFTLARVDAQIHANGEKDPGGGLDSLMDADDLNKSTVPAYRQHYEAVLGQAQALMTGVLESFRPTITGARRNKALLENVVRALFGERVDDAAARELAQAWGEASEWLRLRFNAAGGAIGKLKDWGLPHSHDSLLIRKVPRSEWVQYVWDRLDRSRMLDRDTGMAMSDDVLRRTLGEIHESITNEGWNKRDPQGRALGSAIDDRHSDSRFLIFKNADAWLEYAGRFGEADPFNTMLAHVDGMARDTAAMELFGPTPTATLHYASQKVLKDAKALDALEGGSKHADRWKSMDRRMWNMWDVMRGTANAPINPKWAYALSTTRTMLGAAQLGRAAIGAISDLNYQRIAAGMNGLKFLGTVSNIARLAADPEYRAAAVRSGLLAEEWGTLALAQKRYTDDYLGANYAQRISHFVMTATGLSPWTQFGRWAFGMEFMGTLADQVGRDFGAMPPPLRTALERHGFAAGNWDAMRSAALYDFKGSKFLRANEIADVDPRLADRLLGMIKAETEYAVPSYSLRGKALYSGKGTEPGTIVGELVRSPFMYKSFGLTLMNTHLRRRALEFMMAPDLSAKSRIAARGLDFIVSSALFGAAIWQIKQVVSGRDPVPMDTADFWGAAFLQSGGIGAFSDFFFTDVNAYGRGLPETIGGPVGAFLGDTLKLTAGNVVKGAELAAGQEGVQIHMGRDLVDYSRRYLPGGNIWYAQLAVQRLLYDRLALWADPQAKVRMLRLEAKYRHDFGQRFWWRGGDLAPIRTPDLGNALRRTKTAKGMAQ